MTLLTAEQAATRLNRTERTVRRWINSGMLEATHPTHGRKDKFLIEESEVERLAGELAKEQPAAAASEDTSSLEARIAQLEQGLSSVDYGTDYAVINSLERRLDTFEDRLAALERILSVGTPAQPAPEHPTRTRTRHASTTTATLEPLEHLPQGSTPHYVFAKNHGVNPRTFLDHIHKGHVPSIARQKPNRKEVAHWLSPEQQRAAIAYWQANETPYQECTLCPHSDEIYQRASQDQDAGEDQQSAEAMI